MTYVQLATKQSIPRKSLHEKNKSLKADSNLITRLANNALGRENQNTPDNILQFQYY